MNASDGLTTRGQLVRASVTAGGVETSYSRIGSGPPLLLLVPSTLVQDSLLAALASRFRVLRPDGTGIEALLEQPRGQQSPFRLWLHRFLAGLGVEQVTVVVSERFAAEVETYRDANPGLVTRVLRVADAAALSRLASRTGDETPEDLGQR